MRVLTKKRLYKFKTVTYGLGMKKGTCRSKALGIYRRKMV